MIFRLASFRKPLALFACLLFADIAAAQQPSAEEILAAARMNPLGQQVTLTAQLRNGPTTTPFKIAVDGSVRYQFENPPQELILQLNDESSELTERLGDKSAPVRQARYDQTVRNSGLSYEDLSLKFLYWKSPKILNEEIIRTRKAYRIEIQAPRAGASQYGVARLWIDKESGALLRVEGYDMKGRLVRRFEVISAQKLDGQWMLKQMRIETYDPETGKTLNRSYLEVTGKA